MQYFVKDNKCFRSVIRGTVKVDSVAAGATELVTLKFDEELSADSVCMVTAQEYPLQPEVLAVGNAAPGAEYKGYVLVNVTNPSETGVSNVNLNYIIL
jgi:hypothetical protein